MSSTDPEVSERDEREEKGNFLSKVKGFIHEIGEKLDGVTKFGKPSADVTGIHIPSIDLKKAEIIVDVLIKNPNPVPIPLADINYIVESEGRKLVSGLIPDAGTIHPHGEETIKIPVVIIYEDIIETYEDIKPGSIIGYTVRVELIIDVPIIGRLTFPLEKDGEIPIPYKPDVDLENIHFHSFSFEETVASLNLKLENKNDFDLGLNKLNCDVRLAGVEIGGAELQKTTNIEKQGVSYMDIPITFKPKDFGSALWDMIKGKSTGYSIEGLIDVETPYGGMKMPISKEGGTKLSKQNEEDEENEEKENEEKENEEE